MIDVLQPFNLIQGDCLQVMQEIPDNSIDCIICDLPYGTTACSWDIVIPFDDLWNAYNRIVKKDSAIILFGTEPFSSMLRLSNLKHYKYDLIWRKSKSGSAFTAKYRPINKHEIISVFSKTGGRTQYYPQYVEGTPYKRVLHLNADKNEHKIGFAQTDAVFESDGKRYPDTILDFPQKWRRQDQVHPTQKPVELLEWLIKSYTQEDNLVLDNCMGSGTTGVACKHLNRRFIGIEQDNKYFEIAKERIENE